MQIRMVVIGLIFCCLFAGVVAAEGDAFVDPVPWNPYTVVAEDESEDQIVAGAATQAAPGIDWIRSLGGSEREYGSSIVQTSDGGYFLTGRTASNDGQVTGYHSGSYTTEDIWVVRLSPTGALVWERCLGQPDTDYGFDGVQTADGGFAITGCVWADGGDVSGHHGSTDIWVAKLDATGSLAWQKCIGGTWGEYGYSIRQTSDGGYIIGGVTTSIDGDISGNHGGYDGVIVKLNATGGIEWLRCLGGNKADDFNAVRQTSDGGYIAIGKTYSNNNGTVGANHGYTDIWVVKLTATGLVDWQKCLGSSSYDGGYAILESPDGGYVLTGYVEGNDGDVSGNHGSMDLWVAEIDGIGRVLWQQCLGGSGRDLGTSIVATYGGYVVTGQTESTDGDVSGGHGVSYDVGDLWVVRIDDDGTLIWQKCIGGSAIEVGSSVICTSDGGLAIAGYTGSTDGDIPESHGGYDLLVVKLGSDAAPIPTAESIALSAGWNFVSTPKRLADDQSTASQVFGEVNTSGHSIFAYDAAAGNWTTLGAATVVRPLEGIWIYSNRSTSVPLAFASGEAQTPPSKVLAAGWNSIGFAGIVPVSARDCLLSVSDEWATLLRWDGVEQEYGTVIVNGGSGDAADSALLYPTEGYWIFMRKGGVLGAISG